jgi:translation initiation factor IF-2
LRVYHVARELDRPNRAVLQLLRELGFTVSSHMARLAPEEETGLREAVERQQRGAPAVRAAHTTAPSVQASQVAEVVVKLDLDIQKQGDGKAGQRPGAAPLRPAASTAAKAAPKTAAKPRKPAKGMGIPKPARDKDELQEELIREAEREGIEMVAVDDSAFGPPMPPPGAAPETPQPDGVLRTVDLSAVEDAPMPPPEMRRRAVVNVGGRQIRTLQRRKQRGPKSPPIQASQTLEIVAPISLKDFSQAVGVRAQDMIRHLIQETGDLSFNMNTVLDEARVTALAAAFDRTVVIASEKTAEEKLEEMKVESELAAEGDLVARPPVVTILGHVDHGKTSLLDKIRKTNVAAGEFGGITQHIGAFQVATESGHAITFLDTPGHAAFTAMRARGAQMADVVVLVVAADDGVMPQTEEAINHAKLAEVPIIVAINKVDKPNASPMKVKQQLTAHALSPEDWGGDTICVEVSALTGLGIEQLLESLALVAEVEELKANPEAPASGHVVEARKDPHRGVIATLLVEDGTLSRGDVVVAGMGVGRVRTMLDSAGKTVKEAAPGTPVELFGLDEVPEAGDPFHVVADERLARQAVEERTLSMREGSQFQRPQATLENLFKETAEQKSEKTLNLILKADVRGSLEPLKIELGKLEHKEVQLNTLYAALGAVTQSDVDAAIASNAVVIGFNVLSESAARKSAERAGVQIRHYNVIYEVVDDLKAALENLLAPEQKERITGHAEIRKLFASSKFGNVAGCFVIDGVVRRADYIRIYRDGKLIYGLEKPVQVDSLRRVKDDVKEVREGFECGIRISAYQDIKEGDVIEFYEIKQQKRTLES